MIRLVTDSTITVPESIRVSGKVQVISLYVRWAGQEYEDATMDVDDFYGHLDAKSGELPTSSHPSAATFESCFEEAACAEDEVLGIFISSALSGTYEGALRAARAVAACHPQFKFALIDSSSCGGDATPAVLEALDAIESGSSLDHAAQRALFGVQSSRFLFSPVSLDFLRAGGRIGRASALIGGLMQIRPVLTVTDGSVRVLAKARSHKKALAAIVNQIDADIAGRGGFKRLIVHYIGNRQSALDWVRDVVTPHFDRAVDIAPVSPVIGAHVGPALGIAYQCNLPLQDKITGNVQQLLCTC